MGFGFSVESPLGAVPFPGIIGHVSDNFLSNQDDGGVTRIETSSWHTDQDAGRTMRRSASTLDRTPEKTHPSNLE
jgi:hypothetical protein